MARDTLIESVGELGDSVKSYVNARVDLWKLSFLERFSKSSTFFLTAIVVILTIAMLLLMFAFAFSFWYAESYGNLTGGFLISGGGILVVGIIVILFRRLIFTNGILKKFSKFLFEDEEF